MGDLRPVFGVFAVVAWLVLIGLHTFWHYSFGWLFNTLADLMDKVAIPTGILGTKHLLGPASSFLRSLDKNVDHSLVAAANNLEHTVVWLFSRVGFVFGWLGRQVEAVALGVEHAIGKLIRVTIPRIVTRLLKFVWRELRALGRYARKMIPQLARKLFRYAKWATHKIIAGAKHLGFLWKWVKAIIKYHWKVIKGALKRLHALEKKLTPKGFRKLLIGVLGPLGLIWLLSDSAIRFGKGVVGWSYNLVTAFVRYFKRLDEPFVLEEFIAVERELTHLVLHELEFIVSEFKPRRLAPPGPPFGPPA